MRNAGATNAMGGGEKGDREHTEHFLQKTCN